PAGAREGKRDQGRSWGRGHHPRAYRQAYQPASRQARHLRGVRAPDLGQHLVLGVRGPGRRPLHGPSGLYDGARPSPGAPGGGYLLHRLPRGPRHPRRAALPAHLPLQPGRTPYPARRRV
ncbi:MAG: hypothetical protein AVDCRST_MAG05-2237, partial [uncultured Rubrobacteraceae bacterium]